MPAIEVYLTARSASRDELKGKTVLVIDVLRACSTIVSALDNGARAIIPVADMAEAGKIAEHMDGDTMVMGGERGGVKIEGYQLGNSPLEYTPEAVQGKVVVLNTSNGTAAITRARGAAEVAVASFLNISEAVSFAAAAATDVAIVCAGSDNRVALEDILCAGLILHRLWDGREPAERSDAAHIAFSQYAQDRARLAQAIAQSNHGQHLTSLGYGEDVARCCEIDTSPLLPVYRDSRLVLRDPSRATVSSRPPATEVDEL
jgi:2-phosphosulfolactate phosphatase